MSWIHLLSYTSILQRTCNLDSMGLGVDASGPEAESGSLGAGFDLGFVNHSGFDTGINHEVVRLPLLCGDGLLRLQSMLEFLNTHLSVFATTCQAVKPPPGLVLPFSGPATELSIPAKSYPENVFCFVSKTADESNKNIPKMSDKLMLSSNENELCLQWYQPSTQGPNTTAMQQVLLLYAISSAPTSKSSSAKGPPTETPNPIVGSMTLSLPQVTDLHDRLAVLRQKAEISLRAEKVEKPKPPSTPMGGAPTKEGAGMPGKPTNRKSKRTARITQLSAKVKRDENLEVRPWTKIIMFSPFVYQHPNLILTSVRFQNNKQPIFWSLSP